MGYPRALALFSLVAVGPGLGGCGGRGGGADEPAIAAAGTGIPVGAPNATGVSFQGPTTRELPSQGKLDALKNPPIPPDPFGPGEAAGPDAGAPVPTVNPGQKPAPQQKKKGGGIHL